ncbi:hypothetical protein [Amycolatopsis nigrescens]|uniref:hypothetical protein n=1 Tax=Amycolatopsis nigrescens TaxID=381445 RepID=UPI00038281DB|nr:hypothetical protein [Amycolatopsis nigrescens]
MSFHDRAWSVKFRLHHLDAIVSDDEKRARLIRDLEALAAELRGDNPPQPGLSEGRTRR